MLKSLFAELDNKDVLYCVLRGYKGLPEIIENDIDFFVSETHERQFFMTLINWFLNDGWQIQKNHTSCNYYRKVYFSKNGDTVHVDIWTRLNYLGVDYAPCGLLDRRIRYKDLYVASCSDELEVSVSKDILHLGKLNIVKQPRYRELLELCKGESFKNIREGHRDTVKSIILSRRPERINKFTFLVMLYRGECYNSLHGLWMHLRAIVSEKLQLRRRKILVLLGPDGAGKTTFSQSLLSCFEEVDSVTYLHGRFHIIPDLSYFLGKQSNDRKEFTDEIHSDIVYSFVRGIIYLIYYLFDYVLGHLYRLRFGEERYILFDRYYYDYFIQSTFSRIPIWWRTVYSFFAPLPNVAVYLSCDAEEIYSRKPELSIDEIQKQQLRIDSILHNVRIPVTIADTSRCCSRKFYLEARNKVIADLLYA